MPLGAIHGRDQVSLDAHQLSAFGLVRIGAPFLLADLVNKYQLDANFWGTQVSGTGAVSHVALQSAISVKAGAAVGVALLQTHEFYRYQAGKGTRWLMTGYSSDAGNTNNVRKWGQFDANDGTFFRHARSTVGNYFDVGVRSSVSGVVVDTLVAQSAWNVDKMDGTGPSKIVLDPTKGNIFECTYQWLGVGVVQFWINGYLVHLVEHANLLSVPYMRTAQLPMAVRVDEAGGSAGLSGWTSICTAIYSEGGDEPAQYTYAYGRSGAPFAFSTTETPLMSIRPASLVNGIANRTMVLPRRLVLSAGAMGAPATTVTFKLYLNSTLTTGNAWIAVGNGSNVERGEGTTAAGFAAGILLDIVVMGEQDIAVLDLSSLFTVHGRKLLRRDLASVTLDILTITAKLSASTGSGSCDLQWGETV